MVNSEQLSAETVYFKEKEKKCNKENFKKEDFANFAWIKRRLLIIRT